MSKCTLDTRKHTLLELGVDSASEQEHVRTGPVGWMLGVLAGCWGPVC